MFIDRSILARALAALCALALLGACFAFGAWLASLAPAEDAPVGTQALPGGSQHWQGWVELVPAIATPRLRDGQDRTRIYASFPGRGAVELSRTDEPRSLRVATGSVLDRVELRPIGGQLRVIDVRGTQFADDGGEVFRAYRGRTAGSEQLFGVTWRRDDPAAGANARHHMRRAMEGGLGVVPAPSRRAAMIARYERLMDCASCHAHLTVERRGGGDGGPRRGTDASGLYSLLATLSDSAVLETYRPRDENLSRQAITLTCEDTSAPRRAPHTSWPRCANGEVPRASLDVPAALRAGDPAALALCASRRALAPYLGPLATAAYSRELFECGALHLEGVASR